MSWITKFHDHLLVDTLLKRRDAEETERALDFLVRTLSLPNKGKVLDQCCGIGSLAIPLANRGYEVYGVDITPEYIKRAQEQKSSAQFFCSDACSFVMEDCDAVFNWWTGFGYFGSDEENKKMIARAYDSLRSGGWFLLDVLNPAGVLRAFQPLMNTTYDTDAGKIELLRETKWDLYGGRMNKIWTYRCHGEVLARHETSVRVYHSHELVKFFSSCGFTDIRLLGDLEETPLNIDHKRCICIGRKP